MRGKTFKYEDYHKEIDGILYKKCTLHKKFFPDEDEWILATFENFYHNKKTNRLYPECKECGKEKARINQKANPERTKQTYHDIYYRNKERTKHRYQARRDSHKEENKDYTKYWQSKEENKDKLKSYNKNHRDHDITKEEWNKCLEVFNFKCAYCGITEEESRKVYEERLHKDHIDYNGYNDLRNAAPACKSCNSKKHQSDMEEWFREQEFFTEEKLEFIKWWIGEGYRDYIEDKPPYRILRERDEGLPTYHFNLWSVDEKRNILEIIATQDKKKDLGKDIEKYLLYINNQK